jgi:hypothetical protein
LSQIGFTLGLTFTAVPSLSDVSWR